MELGDFHLTIVSDGKFRLDGGAMFGVVPRVPSSSTTGIGIFQLMEK